MYCKALLNFYLTLVMVFTFMHLEFELQTRFQAFMPGSYTLRILLSFILKDLFVNFKIYDYTQKRSTFFYTTRTIVRRWCIRIDRAVFFGRSLSHCANCDGSGKYYVLMQYCISTTIFTMILKFCQIEVLGGTRSTNEKKIGKFFFSKFFYSNFQRSISL